MTVWKLSFNWTSIIITYEKKDFMVQKTVCGNDPNLISGQNSKLCTLDHQLGEYMNWTHRVGPTHRMQQIVSKKQFWSSFEQITIASNITKKHSKLWYHWWVLSITTFLCAHATQIALELGFSQVIHTNNNPKHKP